MKKKSQSDVKLSLLFILMGLALFGWLAYWAACVYLIDGTEQSASAAIRGQFGDMFGGINALFSAFAFAGLIYTVSLQRKELSLQRQELEETRNELRRSAEAQEQSHKALTEQLTTMRQTVLVSALDTLISVQTRIIERDSQDDVARRSTQYHNTIEKLGHYINALEKLIERFITEAPESPTDSQGTAPER